MNIAVVDDLEKEASKLSEFLVQYGKKHNTIFRINKFRNGSQLLKNFLTCNFDIVFLDIYMKDPDGLNGFEVARQMRNQGFQNLIVFSTVSLDFAVTGYSVNAFDYLVKPFDYDRFCETMDRCMEELSQKSQFIVVKESRTYVKIRLDDIIFTDYHNHYIQIHTPQRMIKSYMRFSDFYALLEPYPQFLNCYRNCIVNMNHAVCLKGYEFIMDSGDIMPITRKRKTDIKQKYADYEFYRLEKGD